MGPIRRSAALSGFVASWGAGASELILAYLYEKVGRLWLMLASLRESSIRLNESFGLVWAS